jgi:murein tripeptide amidase MpaA
MEIKFNIINMLKYDSLFNYGMQVAVFSQKKNIKTGEGWTRAGRRISYEKSELRVENRRRKYYYTLSFVYDFKSEDKVYFAHSYPYTYSRLNELIFGLCSNPIKSKICRREIIGSTLMNLNIECLTFSQEYSIIRDNRKVILIMARQHPGETVGSWVVEGFIDQIVKKTKETDYLKKNYLIKVIPMINPDGVAIGNYRSNLSGSDLNRNWNTEKKSLYPEIVAIRNYIAELSKDRKIKIIIDVHGHSKK